MNKIKVNKNQLQVVKLIDYSNYTWLHSKGSPNIKFEETCNNARMKPKICLGRSLNRHGNKGKGKGTN